MPIPIVNSIASWFLKKRIHQIELFLKYPIEVQDELLKNLLQKAKNTELGKQYDFESIKAYEDFINRVPVTSYEDNESLYLKSRKGETNLLSFQWVFVGALLFIVSDSLLAINRFAATLPFANVAVMVTYIAAQWLIVKGFNPSAIVSESAEQI